MALINQNVSVTAAERRRSHTAGSSAGTYTREVGSSLFTAIVPDESGVMGAGLTMRSATTTGSLSSAVTTFVYLGRAAGSVLSYVGIVVAAAGTGTPNAVVGFATSGSGPDFLAKTVTVVAVQSLDNVNSGTNIVRNTVPMNYAPAAGAHLWAFYNSANSGAQPSTYNLTGSVAAGTIQRVNNSPSAVVLGASFLLSIVPPQVATAQGPFLFVS